MSPPPRPETTVAAKVFPSPNHGERKDGRRPDMLILHYTGMPDAGEALQWLCNPISQVSAHYFVFEDGRVIQMVPEARRAWHAGASYWDGETDLNSRSIGIEIANPGHPGGLPPFPDAQIDSVAALARDIVSRWRIPPTRVLAHSDVAPGRKVDPGELFPWHRLHEAGVGHWVAPASIRDGRFFARGDEGMPIEALQAMLTMYGYGLKISGVFDENTEKVVAAFQRHFRPERVDGVADASTITTLRDLIATRPQSVA
ncbi:N-acetylmuramoyl-L-alanine amidase [Microvirga sp. 17 mud 1-3]|uniref:N-acetylmuramoyl-L-alanine amidase n=1 Tax=Microvirga sp. 17 mud 1-3 TaxID=2082949 RepID=UPI000D6BD892|nr:N-acetylmuramoyl-L-alanine amidase [Microvirga sp. 17 mud 1-3]AWM86422.1 N-acetylmuramoyl-L-alanine amidase [Microvirga sp. 17 mud 1-3]